MTFCACYSTFWIGCSFNNDACVEYFDMALCILYSNGNMATVHEKSTVANCDVQKATQYFTPLFLSRWHIFYTTYISILVGHNCVGHKYESCRYYRRYCAGKIWYSLLTSRPNRIWILFLTFKGSLSFDVVPSTSQTSNCLTSCL
jgi:hypothetical protein